MEILSLHLKGNIKIISTKIEYIKCHFICQKVYGKFIPWIIDFTIIKLLKGRYYYPPFEDEKITSDKLI